MASTDYCPNCRTYLGAGRTSCQHCGSKVTPRIELYVYKPATPAPTATTTSSPYAREEWIGRIAVLVVGFLVVAGIAWAIAANIPHPQTASQHEEVRRGKQALAAEQHDVKAMAHIINAAMGESLIQQYRIQDGILILRVDGDVWNSASEQSRDLAFQQIQQTWEIIRRDRVSSYAIAGIRIDDLAGNTLRQTGMFGQ
jgi:hypothetical protein